MLSVDECVGMVTNKVLGPLETQTVQLNAALGRILAKDAVAVEAIPAFPASIMDGFAMRSKDAPGKYPVDELAGTTAGADSRGPLREDHIRYITTGAPVPAGADTVVKVEDTHQLVDADGKLEIEVLCSSKPGTNIRAVGSDTKQGEVILRKCCRIGAAEIGVLAALGLASVEVFREPRVAIISTGDELVDVGAACTLDRSRGQIVDCNRPLLCALARELGVEALDMGFVTDDLPKLRATLVSAFQQADVVISSGGVSRGSKDFIKELLSEMGEVHFGEMCMKPGKPSTFATVAGHGAQRKLFFGLPGNPVSCFVTFKLLAAPALERLRGLPQDTPIYPRVDAELAGPVDMDPVRPEYHRATARWEAGRIVAESTGFQRSSRIASIADANCLLEIPKDKGTLPKGTVVKALLLPHGSRSLVPSPEGFPGGRTRAQPAKPPPATTVEAGQPLQPRPLRVGLLTIGRDASNDQAFSDLLTVLSSCEIVEKVEYSVEEKSSHFLADLLETWSRKSCQLILVLADLGLGEVDAAVVQAVREGLKEAPGVADAVARTGLALSPLAMLSPVVAGTQHDTLIVMLPSSWAPSCTAMLCKMVAALAEDLRTQL